MPSRPTQSPSRTSAPLPTEHREVEVTLDVDLDWAFPAPEALLSAEVRGAGASSVADPVEHDLDARYVDTTDLRLLRARTTLRRRGGGDDAGWHLKLPASAAGGSDPIGGAARTEVHLPLRSGPNGVPRALAALVLATTRGERLVPVARLRTTRRVHRILGVLPEAAAPEDATDPAATDPVATEVLALPSELADAGERVVVLAEVADDEVSADVLAPGALGDNGAGEADDEAVHLTWREVEVELVEGGPRLLTAVVEALEAAGARRSDHPSKLRRALAQPLAALPPAPPPPPAVKAKSSAAQVLCAHVAAQRDAVLAADPRVRRGEDEAVIDAVHRMRVALRRTRSALASARPLLDVEVTEPLRAELSWLAAQLGAARDAHVVRLHLDELLRGQRPPLLPDDAGDRLRSRADADVEAGLAAAREALGTPRYVRVLGALDDLVRDFPARESADKRASSVLRARARHTHRKLVDAVDTAEGARDPQAHADALHEVRKTAKRARYGAEVLAAVIGTDAQRYARAVEAVQNALGEVQDSVVMRSLLSEVAEQARASGEDTFAYGRLHAVQEARAEHGEAAFEVAWHDLARKRHRRWLD